MLYLLDTKTCIYLIKRRPEKVITHFEALNIGEISISSITVYEMVYGGHKSRNTQASLQALNHFLAPLADIAV
jgi:tRNA(fMet)-specific endonuclease VapC